MDNFFTKLIWQLIPKKIYGLVGASGTGKSFRAFLIAEKYKIEYIIDDGLLIKGQEIIAGKSSKRESLRVTAVKRAIFNEIKHAREVRKKLYKERYNSLLIIATSENMLYTIIKRLHLPKSTKIIRIEDIATQEEIRDAQKSRNKDGKHVIPIPLIEVKKKYPNIVLHAIHFFIDEPRGFLFMKRKKKLIEKTIVRPNYGNNGAISISETALVQMVSHCVDEYSNDIKLLKVFVIEKDEGYLLKLRFSIDYKFNNIEAIREIQNIVKNRIEEFTGISIYKVDINIVKITHV
ncbi:MAG: hypothetical protein KAT05_07230 [Spirochaetes bacterium]|nr:hypothetical protein [Spirochaetota bacterium]